jgi:aminoglycoside phosphotransferase (APT) family kinase protein
VSDPKGLDLGALTTWLERERPELVTGPLSATLITGGKSNLTYSVSTGTREYVVRRPPLGHVLATAHDMGREYRVMAALAPTDVPVPQMVAHCEDADVLGAPFYVMEKVAGTPYGRAAQLEQLGPERTRAITERMVDTLVALHGVDQASVGLADFGRPDGYMSRQVARWKKQLVASTSRDLPGMADLVTYLDANVPTGGEGTIVHGDFRLDNLLVDDDDQVTAVLDWEMATLGDPLADVAILLAYGDLAKAAPPAGPGAALVTDASRAPGYLDHDEILQRYAVGSGRDVGHIGFHLAFAYFKIAVIVEGIHYRHEMGQTEGEGFAGIGTLSAPLIEAGLAATR